MEFGCKNSMEFGCKACGKCYLCRRYLVVCSEFTSFHTDQRFRHRSIIDCNTECIIYLLECILHEKSYVGYTIKATKIRFSNTKSHIKKGNKSCEIVSHFIENEHPDIDFSSAKKYDESLCKYIKVTLLEKVQVNPDDNREQREAKCEAREGYWQTQLRTLTMYGGLNKRDNRKYTSLKNQGK